jgi:hypothetical protein
VPTARVSLRNKWKEAGHKPAQFMYQDREVTSLSGNRHLHSSSRHTAMLRTQPMKKQFITLPPLLPSTFRALLPRLNPLVSLYSKYRACYSTFVSGWLTTCSCCCCCCCSIFNLRKEYLLIPISKTENTALGVRPADHVTLSNRKSWH